MVETRKPSGSRAIRMILLLVIVVIASISSIFIIPILFQPGPKTDQPPEIETFSPGTPTGLSASNQGIDVYLTWTTPPENKYRINSYNVYWSSSIGSETFLISTNNYLPNHVDSIGRKNGANYYKVSAVNSKGEGELSNEAFIMVSIPTNTVSSPPLNLQGSVSGTSVVLTWSAPSSNGNNPITAYNIYLEDIYKYSVSSSTFTYSDNSWRISGINNYKMTAINILGESSPSNTLSITYTNPIIVDYKPGKPTSLSASTSGSNVILSWQAPADNGFPITGYRILIGHPAAVPYSSISVIGSVLTYTDSIARTDGTNYYYIRAINSQGEGQLSDYVLVIVSVNPGIVLPSEPRNVQASVSGTSVVITWQASLSSGSSAIRYYKIYLGELNIGLVAGNILTYTDSTYRKPGVNYYKVAALNDQGDSLFSNVASIIYTLPVTPPSAPINLRTFLVGSDVYLVCDPPADNGGVPIIKYNLYFRMTDSKGNMMQSGSQYLDTAALITQITSTGLKLNKMPTTYICFYKVTAINGNGEGQFSNEVQYVFS